MAIQNIPLVHLALAVIAKIVIMIHALLPPWLPAKPPRQIILMIIFMLRGKRRQLLLFQRMR